MPARQCCSLLCNSKIAASIVMRMGTVMNREDGGLGASFSVFSFQCSVFSVQCLRLWDLAGSFTTLLRPKAGSARHSCRVRCADNQPFHFTLRVVCFSCRVVHDPSAAEGRFGPAFMPGTLSFATAQLNTGAQWAPLVPYRASTPRWHTPLPTTCSKTHNQESPRCASQWSGWY